MKTFNVAMLFAWCVIATAVVADDVPNTSAERLRGAATEAHNWLHHHRTYDAQRYSPLKQINRDNIQELKVAWTYALGGTEGGGIWPSAGLEATPIVEEGAMYMVDGWGVVTKLDVSDGRAVFQWRMDPGTDKDWAGSRVLRYRQQRRCHRGRPRHLAHA